MIELLKLLLSLSLSGTLLILVLLLCKPLCRNTLSRQWQYYIWLIAVARLLLPFTPETSLMGGIFQSGSHAIAQIYTSEQQNPEPDNAVTSDRDLTEHKTVLENQNRTTASKLTQPEKPFIQNGWLICGWVWMMTAVGLLIRKVTIYQSFVKYLKAGCVEVTDMKLWEQLGKLVEQADVKTTVGLYINSLVSSPLLIGFFHPCIILPSSKLSDSDFEYTILHELTHYKRRDMFYKWLVQITICLHWFNPLVHRMGKEVGRACEFSCDEAVIRRLDKKARRAYGDTLLHAMGTGGSYHDALASVTLSEHAKLLEERLEMIMNFKKKTKWSISVTLLLTVILAYGFTFTGAYGAVNVSSAQAGKPDIEPGGEWAGMSVYFIYTEKGLRSIETGDSSSNKMYMLQSNIELSSDEWVPIGTADKPFKGTFNGNGCFIKGLTITDPGTEAAGLFGYAQGAKLHNIELREVDIVTATDSICAVPSDTKMTDNRVYQKVEANPDEQAAMETLDFKGKTYYLVFNEAQLRTIGTGAYGMDKNYMQQADIQMSTKEWIPIGTEDRPFTGSYNGNGYEIKGLTMTDPDAKVIGFFGYARGAAIHNITMRDYDILTAGSHVKPRSIAPVLVFGEDTRSFDNYVYPRQ